MSTQTDGDRPDPDPILRPITFPGSKLTVKNRVFRSSISGQFDSYDGAGGYARINWEEKFASGGVGAIISSFVPVTVRGRILPGYATIHEDRAVGFWRALGQRVHEHGCKYLMQLSHSGRQQDIQGVENQYRLGLSATDAMDSFHGLLCRQMTRAEIRETIDAFGAGARRAREAGLDGVETHSAHGYLINQFLSSGINTRKDEYGGSLENRYRLLREIVRAIRREAGDDFHLQCKINGEDHNNAIYPWERRGNTIEDAVQICRWLEQDGVNALHISTGSIFPHPRNTPGDFPLEQAIRWYDRMLSSGVRTHFNYRIFRGGLLGPLFRRWWRHRRGPVIEGINATDAAEIKKHVTIPVIVCGGIQRASLIRRILDEGMADAVAIARPLIANNDLVRHFERGLDQPPRPCTFCNKCLLNAIENPLGCYELSRYDGDYDRMIAEVMSVFHPSPYESN